MARGPVVYETAQRFSYCRDCDVKIPDFRDSGRMAERCRPCKLKVKVAYQKRTKPPRLIDVVLCIDCGIEYQKSTRATTRVRCDECRKKYGAGQRRAWMEAHPEIRQESARKWFEANRAYVKNAKHGRRVLERASSERFTRDEIFDRDGWICQLCRLPVDASVRFPHNDSASLDHVIPVALGGDHTRANTQLAHMGCNRQKGARRG